MFRAAGEPHQVPDGEEVGLVAQLRDQRQFVLDQPADLVGDAGRVAVVRPRPRSVGSGTRAASSPPGRVPRGSRSAARRARRCSGRRPRPCARRRPGRRRTARRISSGDFRCRSALGKRRSPSSATVQPCRIAVSTSCSGRRRGRVVVHVVGGDERQPGVASEVSKMLQPVTIERPAVQLRDGVAAVAEHLAAAVQVLTRSVRTTICPHAEREDIEKHAGQKTLRMVRHVVEGQAAFALRRRSPAQGEQPGQTTIARAVHRPTGASAARRSAQRPHRSAASDPRPWPRRGRAPRRPALSRSVMARAV